MLWWLLLLVVLLGVILLFVPIQFEFRYEHDQPVERVQLFIRYLYLIRVQKRWVIPTPSIDSLLSALLTNLAQETQQTHPNEKERVKRKKQLYYLTTLWSHFDQAEPLLLTLLRKIAVREFTWTTSIGMRDAAHTAMACGMAWRVKSAIVGLTTQLFSFRKSPFIGVIPNYHIPNFTTKLSWIGTVSIGNTMIAGAKLLWLLKMGGAHARTSDSIPNANSNGKSQGNG